MAGSVAWAAVATWGATALGGFVLAAIFLLRGGLRQGERESIGPLRVLPHVGLAVAGFGVWVAYADSHDDDVAWAGVCLIFLAFVIAGTMMLTRDIQRRRQLVGVSANPPIAGGAVGAAASSSAGGGHSAATGAPATAARARVYAEQHIPITVAGLHGLLGVSTLVLVLLNRALVVG
jgi:hypothetical protein